MSHNQEAESQDMEMEMEMEQMPEYINPEECIEIDGDAPEESDGEDMGVDIGDDDATRAEQYGMNDDEIHTESDGLDADVNDGSDFSSPAHAEAALSVAICPTDSSLIVTGGQDDKAILWRMPEDAEKKLIKLMVLEGHTDSVVSIEFSKDGQFFATASYDNTIRVYRQNGELVSTLEGPAQEIEWMVWHPKGHAILAGSTDSTAWLWWAPTGKVMQVFAGHGSSVSAGCFCKNGQMIATASLDGSLVLWNPREGTPIHTFRELGEGGIISMGVHPTQPVIAASCEDGTTYLINVETNKVLKKLHGHSDSVESTTFFASDSHALMTTAGLDGKLNIWDSNKYHVRAALSEHAANGGIVKVKWHPAGQPFVCTASTDNTMRWYDARNGKCLRVLEGHTDGVLDLALADLGTTAKGAKMVRVASVSDDKNLKVWDCEISDDVSASIQTTVVSGGAFIAA